jgi:hypothetical protein
VFENLPTLSEDIVRSLITPEADSFARLAIRDLEGAQQDITRELNQIERENPGLAKGIKDAVDGLIALYQAHIWPVESMVLRTWLLKGICLICRGLDHACWAEKMGRQL